MRKIILLSCFTAYLLFNPLHAQTKYYKSTSDQDLKVKLKSICLILNKDTILDFEAKIINGGIFNTDIYKYRKKYYGFFLLSNSSKLVIICRDKEYVIEEFKRYFEKKSSISITYVIKDLSYTCTDIEFTQDGKQFISQKFGGHSDEPQKKFCNICILESN